MDITKIQTPKADAVLKMFTFVTKEGIVFNDSATHSQRVIIEIILNRGINNESMQWINRVHLMAYTRHGKSLAIAVGVSVRAATKHEPWAIVAGTAPQSLIIMDYILHFCVNDPILVSLLATDAKILRAEHLTQRRARNHITFLNGGEIRTFHSKATMGFGCKNVVEDEAGLISNDEHSRVFRMLGDSMDNFLLKVGNPWFSVDETTGQEHHFFASFTDPAYFCIDIPVEQGIAEGRVNEKYHNEVKTKPNYDILYKNTFPGTEQTDSEGYTPLLSHATIKRALVEPKSIESAGDEKLAADPADAGENESVIAKRSMNLARIVFRSTETNCLQFADKIANNGNDIEDWWVDKQGVGTGTVNKLLENAKYFRKVNPVNTGLPVPKNIKGGEQFLNMRAYIFWNMKIWVEQGNYIEKTPGIEKQLMALKYRNNQAGKIVIISKEKLQKRKIFDLGLVDAISMTFCPKTKKAVPATTTPSEGVQPYYPDLGY